MDKQNGGLVNPSPCKPRRLFIARLCMEYAQYHIFVDSHVLTSFAVFMNIKNNIPTDYPRRNG